MNTEQILMVSNSSRGNDSVIVDLPSDPKDRDRLAKAIMDIDAQLTKIEIIKESNKEGIEAIAEEFDIPAKYIRKLVNTFHAQTMTKLTEEFQSFEAMYSGLFDE